jgi:hypothetical protein
MVYVFAGDDKWREDSYYVWVRAGAGEDVLFEQRVAHLGSRTIADEAEQEALALDPDDRAHQATVPYLCFSLAYVCQQAFVLDSVDDCVDGGGCKWPAAERGTKIAGTEPLCDVTAAEDGSAGDASTKGLRAPPPRDFALVSRSGSTSYAWTAK